MNFSDNKAIYLQIADYIMEKIINKEWELGTKIPSVRETAVEVEVNPNTVMRTYSYLEDEGIIQNKRGIGFFVEENSHTKILKLKREDFIKKYLPEVFKMMDLLNISFNDLKKLKEEIKK